jgi:hypothetical protein
MNLRFAWFIPLVAVAVPALAEDPPLRVGTLSYRSGEVNFALQTGEDNTAPPVWDKAHVNQPVSQDMALQTGPDARAQIRIGPDQLELSGDTLFHVLNLNRQAIEASLREGRVFLALHQLGDGENVELVIPNGSVYLLQPGDYDVRVGNDGEAARISVLSGKARLVGGSKDQEIDKGQQVDLAGLSPAAVTAKPAREQLPPRTDTASIVLPPPAKASSGAPPVVVDLPQPPPAAAQQPAGAPPRQQQSAPPAAAQPPSGEGNDDFLHWAASAGSDSHGQAPPPAGVSPQITGFDELAAYGAWHVEPELGPVWFPNAEMLPADWAPYRYGHWASIPPWGWTWIDDQPWGFAPFHYGRWRQFDSGRWGWVPGTAAYAPALVTFITAEDGTVGWVPLAPGEAFAPWYKASEGYKDRLNRSGKTGSAEKDNDKGRGATFANARAGTVVPRDAFARGEPVGRAKLAVAPDRLAHAVAMRGEAPHVAAVVAHVHTSWNPVREAAAHNRAPGHAAGEHVAGQHPEAGHFEHREPGHVGPAAAHHAVAHGMPMHMQHAVHLPATHLHRPAPHGPQPRRR